MSGIELVCALLSFVYALALTHLLQSASDLWVARDRVKVSASLIAWMLLAVLVLVNNWLALIPLAKSEWSPVAVMTNFLTAVIQYFTCSLASMKAPDDGPIDMRAYEDRNEIGWKIAYLALCLLVVVSNGMQYELWAGEPFTWAGLLISSWTILSFAFLIGVSMVWKARWVQTGVPLIYCGLMAYGLFQA